MADAKKIPPLDAPKGIIAYHGSPYTFDRFDISKIGTGEGAQAYGHGLYFAGQEETARHYRDTLSQYSTSAAPLSPTLSDALDDYRGDVEGLLNARLKLLAEWEAEEPSNPYVKELRRDVQQLQALKSTKPPGSIYQVRLKVEPESLLDWDAPLSSQPQPVQQAIKEWNGWRPTSEKLPTEVLPGMEPTGAHVYGHMTRVGSLGASGDMWRGNPQGQVFATEELREAGVPGLKYRDGGSRGADRWTLRHTQGGIQDFPTEEAARAFSDRYLGQYTIEPPRISRNYVMFDDKLVDILKRYALPAAVGYGLYETMKPQTAYAAEMPVAPRLALNVGSALDPTGAVPALREGLYEGEDFDQAASKVPERLTQSMYLDPLQRETEALAWIDGARNRVLQAFRPIPASAQKPRETYRSKAPPLRYR
jgi:hypothetical protein